MTGSGAGCEFGVSVVIPAYNEESAIARQIDEVEAVMRSTGRPFEIIVVDDGSTDRTAERAAVRNVRLIRRGANYGYGAALKAGIAVSEFDWILITDADGTYPSAAIPELLARVPAADMVVGARTGKNVHVSRWRQPAKWGLRQYASYLTGRSIPDLNSGLRLMRKAVVETFLDLLPSGFSFTTTITLSMISNGYSVAYVLIDYFARIGNSKIRPSDFFRFFWLITRLMAHFNPVRLVLPAVLALLALGYMDFRYDTVPVDRSGAGLTSMSGLALVAAGMIRQRARQLYAQEQQATGGGAGGVRRALANPAVRLLGSLLILLLLVWMFPDERLLRALRGIPIRTVASAVGVFVLIHVMGAWKWHLLVNHGGAGLRFASSLRLYFNGLFSNLFLPSLIGGDVVMVVLATRETRNRGAIVLGSLLNRALDLVGLVAIGAAGVVLLGERIEPQYRTLMDRILVAAAAVGSGFVLLLWLRPERFPDKIQELYRKHRDLIGCLKHPRMYAAPLAIGIAMQICLAGLTAWIGAACGLEVGWSAWFLVWALAKLLAFAPVTLGGIGAREVAMVALLAPFGVGPGPAIATGLAWDGVLVGGSLVAGIASRILAAQPGISGHAE